MRCGRGRIQQLLVYRKTGNRKRGWCRGRRFRPQRTIVGALVSFMLTMFEGEHLGGLKNSCRHLRWGPRCALIRRLGRRPLHPTPPGARFFLASTAPASLLQARQAQHRSLHRTAQGVHANNIRCTLAALFRCISVGSASAHSLTRTRLCWQRETNSIPRPINMGECLLSA